MNLFPLPPVQLIWLYRNTKKYNKKVKLKKTKTKTTQNGPPVQGKTDQFPNIVV
jgi:hypothetical protein